jgi:hypothetical protein
MKENYIYQFLKEKYNDLIVHNKISGCSGRRPDFLIERYTHTIIIECDEDQHSGYSCENKRTMEIFQDLGSRPIVFIRFNPDKYDDCKTTCFEFDKNNRIIVNENEWKKRQDSLVTQIEYYMNNIPEKEVTTHRLFYSEIEHKIEDVKEEIESDTDENESDTN